MVERRDIRRSAVKSAAGVGAMLVAYALAPLQGRRWWLGAVIAFVVLVATVPLTVRRVLAVTRADQPALVAAEALVLLLTMLVVGFAACYLALDHDGTQFQGLDTKIDSLYFTVTTLSTVGFGDITAVSQPGRLAVTIQIVFDLAFLGIAVRVLAAAARRSSARSESGGAPR